MVGQRTGTVGGTVSASTRGGAAINEIEKEQDVSITGKLITYTVYSSTAYKSEQALFIVATSCYL